MAELTVNDIAYDYADAGVAGITFALESGSVTGLVGASGSGKTTILKLIAGFHTPRSGEIRIGGKRVAEAGRALAPHKRGVGLVFQQHALLPHLNVADNILFGCKESGPARAGTLERLLADFHLEHFAERFPHQLSGGEQQRVALARALAAKPSVLLMDEPFASIDSVLRRAIRQECISVLRKTGVTTLIVTHDAEEAMELADQIVVLESGRIAQVGTPHDVYFHPKTMQVAGLFGEMNRITDGNLIRALGGPDSPELLLRPELLEITPQASAISGVITHTHFRGNHHIVCVQLAGFSQQIKVHTHRNDYASGDRVNIAALG